jgi:succinate dehydrogenase flavin-adding protein (antitoxin of CptAB toxin-antitoxin module)
MIVKIAKSFQAGLTLFNFAEPSIPEMDDDYAQSFFMNKGMSKVNGLDLKLVNIEKATAFDNLESILDQHDIDLIAAMNGRKDLLYKLDFG